MYMRISVKQKLEDALALLHHIIILHFWAEAINYSKVFVGWVERRL